LNEHLVSVIVKLRKDQVEIMDELEINRSKFFRDMVDKEYLNDNHLSEKKHNLEEQLRIVDEQIEKVKAKKIVEDVITDIEEKTFKLIKEKFEREKLREERYGETPTSQWDNTLRRYWNDFCRDNTCHITLNTFKDRFTRWNKTK